MRKVFASRFNLTVVNVKMPFVFQASNGTMRNKELVLLRLQADLLLDLLIVSAPFPLLSPFLRVVLLYQHLVH